ncbi:MAG TPA: hypothetical protein VII55_01845 [Candidatus Saccharimonadales bacterium]
MKPLRTGHNTISSTMSIGEIASGPNGDISLYDHEAIAGAEASLDRIRVYLGPDPAEYEHVSATRVKNSVLSQAETLMIQRPGNAADVEEIVIDNSLDGHELPPLMGRWGVVDKQIRTSRLLTLYGYDPELASVIVERNVAGFHGSQSGSLMNVLRGGLLPAEQLRAEGSMVSTGERMSWSAKGQDSTSFVDWRDKSVLKTYAPDGGPLTLEKLMANRDEIVAAAAANSKTRGEDHIFARNFRLQAEDISRQIAFIEAHPDSEEAQLMLANFPVAYGMDISGYDLYDAGHKMPAPEGREHAQFILNDVMSDMGAVEFMVYGGVPTDKLAIIAVPKDRIAQVQAMVQKAGLDIKIAAIEALLEK